MCVCIYVCACVCVCVCVKDILRLSFGAFLPSSSSFLLPRSFPPFSSFLASFHHSVLPSLPPSILTSFPSSLLQFFFRFPSASNAAATAVPQVSINLPSFCSSFLPLSLFPSLPSLPFPSLSFLPSCLSPSFFCFLSAFLPFCLSTFYLSTGEEGQEARKVRRKQSPINTHTHTRAHAHAHTLM